MFEVPIQLKGLITPWLAYPVIIKSKKINRQKLQIFLEKNDIQTRTIFTGNILKQPVMKNRKYSKHPKCDYIADNVMKNGILLGCHQGMKKTEHKYMCKTFSKFLKQCN